jgi:uncharacterized protein YuzB (UPF0349 family)
MENVRQQLVNFHELPDIRGITFRGFRGEADYPAIVAIAEGSKDFDRLERVTTLEDIQRSYSHLTNCDPCQDMLFAGVNRESIAYCRVC